MLSQISDNWYLQIATDVIVILFDDRLWVIKQKSKYKDVRSNKNEIIL